MQLWIAHTEKMKETQMRVRAAILVMLVTLMTGSSAQQLCNDFCFCPTTTTMSCSGRDLSQPPAGSWPNIVNLNLDFNNIQQLYPNSFSGFPILSFLYLIRNALTELDLGALSDAKSLHQLYAQSNQITKIVAPPAGKTLNNLAMLYLTGNKIASLDPDVLLAAPNLVRLDLDQNPLVVPSGKSVLNHPTLGILNLMYGASLNLGTASFAGLPQLRQLNLESSFINSIGGAFASNRMLASVTLINTSVTEVPSGTFAPAKALRLLFLHSNSRLQRFPASAVQEAMPSGGFLVIDNSPLACNCEYESLFWWAKATGVSLHATCNGTNRCPFIG